MKEGLPVGKIPADTPVGAPQQHMACAHDAEGEFPFNLFYKRMYRAIDTYADSEESSSDRPRFHACLVEHIKVRPRGIAEYGGADELAQDVLNAAGAAGRFNSCFKRTIDGKL